MPNNLQEIIEKFREKFVRGGQTKPNDVNGLAEYDSWIEAFPEEIEDFIREILSRQHQADMEQVIEKIPGKANEYLASKGMLTNSDKEWKSGWNEYRRIFLSKLKEEGLSK